jgi:rod shape determining protein RodA
MWIDRKLIENFDWRFFTIVLCLLGIGILSIYSITYHQEGRGGTAIYMKQLYWIGIGLIVFLTTLVVDYHELCRFSYLFYVLVIITLVLVLMVGRVSQGARRWLSLGIVTFQPAEFARLALVMVLAKYFSSHQRPGGFGFSHLLVPFLLLLIPLVLIIKQPDLGTALALIFTGFAILLLAGLRSRSLAVSFFLSVMSFPFVWHFFWSSLKDYQRDRLATFLDPSSDPMGRGYHLLQSKIAIGSGGLLGKGLFGATQSQLKFLPEGHTDFIFAVFSEEWGFVGVFLLLTLYLFVILLGFEIAVKAKDALGTYLAAGIMVMFTFYLIMNIGMTLGLLPVVGVPLPLMSYGGTSIVITLASLGLLMNVKLRRFMLFY